MPAIGCLLIVILPLIGAVLGGVAAGPRCGMGRRGRVHHRGGGGGYRRHRSDPRAATLSFMARHADAIAGRCTGRTAMARTAWRC